MSLAEQFKANFRTWIMKQDAKNLQKFIEKNGSEFGVFSFRLSNSNWKLFFDANFNLIQIVENIDNFFCEYIFSGFTFKKKDRLETAVFSCRDIQHGYRFNSNQILTEANVHKQILFYLPGQDTLCLETGFATAIKAVPYYTTLVGFFPEEIITDIKKENRFIYLTGSVSLTRHEERFKVTEDFEFDIANNDLSEKEIMALFDGFT